MSTATASASTAATPPPMAAINSPRTLGEAIPYFLRQTSPRIVIAALALATVARVAVGDWSAWDVLPVAGLVAWWPVQEWLIHVFILHYKPRRLFGRVWDFRVPQSHRAHHREPWNVAIGFIPLQSFTFSLPLLCLLWFGLMPTAALALSGLVTYLALTLHYEWVHFLVHTRYQPRSAWYQRLWRNHRLHHFKNEHYWMGVTMLGGDRLFGTAPATAEVPTSATCRELAA